MKKMKVVLAPQIAVAALLGLSACGWIDQIGKDSDGSSGQSMAAAPVASASEATDTAAAEAVAGTADESGAGMAADTAAAGATTVTLSGANEVPANPSTASGSAAVAYDPATRTVSWNVSYEGLSSAAKAAHFHGPAGEAENAGVQLNIGEGGLASPLVGSAQISEDQAAELMAGRWYINIHSATYPDGEIRGQVQPGGAM